MLNWLRRRFRKLERRWIPDEEHRTAHEERVRDRLAEPTRRPADPAADRSGEIDATDTTETDADEGR
ncbi:MAG: hypothetical protein K5924_06115 [Chloroflexi bacterium]|nr:hypothetical protein [Chloroflexota bacterium]